MPELIPNFRPLHDRVLVKRIPAEVETPGGLAIPEQAQDRPTEAYVIAVGDGHHFDDGTTRELHVRVGDRVLFGNYTGTEATIEGEDYIILREALGFFEQ